MTLKLTGITIQATNMARKRNSKVLLKINSRQIEAIERQYWSRYNNSNLESMLRHKLNTNNNG